MSETFVLSITHNHIFVIKPPSYLSGLYIFL